MAVVETVRGPVDLGNLGQTLMHEHVYVLSTEHVQNYGSDWWDEEAMVARAIDKLNAVYAKGIRTIVDPTVWGLGRDIPRMQRIAAQTQLNIIVATGLYVYEELPQQYAYRGPGLLIDIPEPMVTDFSHDITEGIAGTGVKAAFLKFALETPNPAPASSGSPAPSPGRTSRPARRSPCTPRARTRPAGTRCGSSPRRAWTSPRW